MNIKVKNHLTTGGSNLIMIGTTRWKNLSMTGMMINKTSGEGPIVVKVTLISSTLDKKPSPKIIIKPI
jgi:hypothetical protein